MQGLRNLYFHNEREHSVGQDVEAENTQKQRNDYLDRLNIFLAGARSDDLRKPSQNHQPIETQGWH